MLLTLNPNPQNGTERPHEQSRFRPTPRSPSPTTPDHPAAAPSRLADPAMDSSRSGLPRASSLNLPPPDVGFAAMSSTTANHQLPPPPSQWQGSDGAMHDWLQAKAEEDRRRQEEEKTRQESLRLEQRKVEQSMLRDSLTAGMPPQIVPLIFAGICQNGLPPPVLELAQQYLSQMPGARAPHTQVPSQAPSHLYSQSHSNPQSRRPSMHSRQDSRSGPVPYVPTSAQQAVPPPPPPNILMSQNVPPNTSGPLTPQPSGGHTLPTGPADPRAGMNPWLSHAGGVHGQSSQMNMGNVQYAPGTSHPVAPVPQRPSQESRRSPPALYFHHWVPPAQSQSGAGSGKTSRDSPAPSNKSRRPENHVSPGRKRKATGPHQPSPAPSSRPSESQARKSQKTQAKSSRGGKQADEKSEHRRQASDTSAAHRDHHSGDVKVENSGPISPSQTPKPPGDNPNPRETGNSPEHKRSEDPSPVDGNTQDPSHPFDTRPCDSDIEPSSQKPPKVETRSPFIA